MPTSGWSRHEFVQPEGRYPALILGSRVATGLIIRIACGEPSYERQFVNEALENKVAVNAAIRRLEANGLIQRYGNLSAEVPTYAKKYIYLNRYLPVAAQLRELSYSAAATFGLSIPDEIVGLPPESHLEHTAREVKLDRLFGSRSRTLAIVITALAGYLDGSTIARVTNVAVGNSPKLLYPLVDGGVLRRVAHGRLMLYSLATTPWEKSVQSLCRQMAQGLPSLAVVARLAEELRDAGDSPPRRFLRKSKRS